MILSQNFKDMKSVLMTLFLLTGLGMASLDAQTCTPSPACAKACLDKNADGKKARKASMASCTPEEIAACKATCTPEQIAACKAKCTPEQMAACKAATADGGLPTPMALPGVVEVTPGCRPAGSTVATTSNDSAKTGRPVNATPKKAKVVVTKS